MVTFYEFVQNALKVLQGRTDLELPPTFKVPLSVPIRRMRRPYRIPARHLTSDGNGGFTVRTTGEQGSHILSSMSQANCLIVLPADMGACAVGDRVDVQLLEGLI
jgi:molybdopterin molybdotransferase